CMSAFSNFALSLSIICILAGGVTSFHQGFCSVGGAAIGLGWPLSCLFSLVVAAAMGQVASAFPTAGGLYHWASVLGGRFWGWLVAWLNLVGLVAVLAAIDVGLFLFLKNAFGPIVGGLLGVDPRTLSPAAAFALQAVSLTLIVGSQAFLNHVGLRTTARLIDFSGYWILFASAALAVLLMVYAPSWEFTRLVTFHNFSGEAGGVWPATTNMAWLFALGLLLPAYTITGFDGSAHTAEETVGAARAVPWAIVQSVAASGTAGWVLLCAVVLAMPSVTEAAAQGPNAFVWTLEKTLPAPVCLFVYAAIGVAQYLCGLATVTSTSRMAFAFARDGGLPFSSVLRRVDAVYRTPTAAIWTVAGAAVAFTLYTPFYDTIAAVCVIFLYLSYVLPTLLGLFAYGRSWTVMGPWDVGGWFRPLAVVSALGCLGLVVIGMAPPNEKAAWVVGGVLLFLTAFWLLRERTSFRGPPSVRGLGAASWKEPTP
ncbi:MAG: amino acid permease, partial [Planctomycetia bacterium]